MKKSTILMCWALIRTLVVFHYFHQQSYAQVQDMLFDAQEDTDFRDDEGSSDLLVSDKLGVNDEETSPVSTSDHYSVVAVDSKDESSCRSESYLNKFLHIMLSGPTSKSYVNVSYIDGKADILSKGKKPKCLDGEGCDIPLHCFNYSSLTDNASVVLEPPQAVSITPLQLEQIIENPSIENNCVLVMFYAPWCEFSTKFARRFNTIGRMFRELPVLAVDLSENEPHKYVLAYLPVVAFYHRSRVIYRFKLTESMEGLRDMLVKMTGFYPLNVSLTDEESELPVPVIRSKEETRFLYFAFVWIVFVLLVYISRSSHVSNCLSLFVSKLQGTRTA